MKLHAILIELRCLYSHAIHPLHGSVPGEMNNDRYQLLTVDGGISGNSEHEFSSMYGSWERVGDIGPVRSVASWMINNLVH